MNLAPPSPPGVTGFDDIAARVRALIVAGDERILEVPLGEVTLSAAMSWVPDDAILWISPDGLRACGFGVAARLVASGPARFEELASGAEQLFQRVDTSECSSATRLYIGASFADTMPNDGLWRGFAAADATLPAVTVQEIEPSVWVLRIAVTRSSVFPVLAGQIRRVMRGVASARRPERTVPVEQNRAITADYPALVSDIVQRIGEGSAEKIVAARRVQIRVSNEIEDTAAMVRLDAAYPGCHRFAFRRSGATFLGASPEVLVQLDGDSVTTVALAGSAPATPEGEAMLQASAKDAAEHAHVVDHLRSALGPFCERLDIADQARIRRLRHILHLETPVSAKLAEPVHVLRLVAALHPTPAVGGVPINTASDWIDQHEGAHRGWYSGPIGWFDSAGDGELAVAIRSGLIRETDASLWAGAGIVQGSDAALEDAETLQKLRPLLHAIGIEE